MKIGKKIKTIKYIYEGQSKLFVLLSVLYILITPLKKKFNLLIIELNCHNIDTLRYSFENLTKSMINKT